jgi:catechol 2,3-dioxygenase-like lactoylglutathione lyase family enzyme
VVAFGARPRHDLRMNRFQAAIPILRIYDEAKALEFYRDFLGFSVDWRVGGGDVPVYMQLSLGACRLQLSEHFGDGTPGSKLKIRTDDLPSFQADLLAKQYRHARPGLLEQDWEEREMPIDDPFQNVLIFFEPTPPKAT